MTTEVLMKRPLFGEIVRQNSQTGFICANDIVMAGNKYRVTNMLKMFDFRAWIDSQSNKEFIKEMESNFGKVIETKRGASGGTWMHPFICIDLALSIDPKLKIEVYQWLYDELLKYRNNSGDSYKKMCGSLYENCNNKSNFHRGITKTAEMIKSACNVNDWQKATEYQLKLRDKIHNNISLLCDVLRDNNQAIRIGILKSVEVNK
jgi:hypothetical protein